MKINAKNSVSIAEANQDFSRVAKMVDESGSVIILKNNAPRYLLVEFEQTENRFADNDELLEASNRLMKRNRSAYEELAK